MKRILIIEDDTTFSNILNKFLKKNSFDVAAHPRISSGVEALTTGPYDLVLLDYRLPDGTALDLLTSAAYQTNRLPVIIMTSFHDIRTAVKAMKLGARDYITKPVNPEELLMSIRDIFKKSQAGPSQSPVTHRWISGESEASRHMHNYMDLVAPTEISVLIQGESGTGKEYVARTIHKHSKRMKKPFVAVDCGALSPELAASELFGHVKGSFTSAIENKTGHFEEADGGTLFLDEISNLSYENQMKLLRAIQEKVIQPIGSNTVRKVDVRIITATNDDLFQMVKNGNFRQDLYHRINEFKIAIAPLRDRREDLNLFVDHFKEEANIALGKQVTGFSPEVMEIFKEYHWPGNLRELKNVVKRAVLLATEPEAGVDTLPNEMLYAISGELPPQEGHTPLVNPAGGQTDLKALRESNEKMLIANTLEKVKHNKSKAAKLLNIDRKTLYNKISRYKIE